MICRIPLPGLLFLALCFLDTFTLNLAAEATEALIKDGAQHQQIQQITSRSSLRPPLIHHRHLVNANNTSTTSSRIVGGTEATLGAFPSFAYWSPGCGATLITPQVALTAAHCYLGMPGTLYLNSIDRQSGDAYEVDYVRIHPNFNGNRVDPDWDFMILKLVREVPASVATPVLLNSDPLLPRVAGEIVTAVGFGRLGEGDKEDSDSLQRVALPFVTDSSCATNYNTGRINAATICAGREGLDACQGDSGGPLYLGSNGDVQIGITSWGMGCARPGFPGVYARISTGYPWIQAQTCIQSDNLPPNDFCEGASVSIKKNLEIDFILEDAAIATKMTWGLYAIDQATTLYETEIDDLGVITVNANTAITISSSLSAIARKKEDDEDETNNDNQQQQQDEQDEQDVLEPNQVKLEWDNLSPGKYYFQLRNPLGTGLGSDVKSRVWINQGERRRGVTVPHGFGSFYDVYFEVTAEHSVTEIRQQYRPESPVSPPQPMVEIMVDVFYDDNAAQVSWELKNLNTNEVLAFIAAGSITETKYESYVYNVEQGNTYQVTVRNSDGRGLADGWVSVWVGLDMKWKSDQLTAPPFTFELVKSFQV